MRHVPCRLVVIVLLCCCVACGFIHAFAVLYIHVYIHVYGFVVSPVGSRFYHALAVYIYII